MASCATPKSRRRSSAENSLRGDSAEERLAASVPGWSGVCTGICTRDAELGRGGDIAIRLGRNRYRFSATAENKGPALALHHAPVDLRPEGDKVIDRRHQGYKNHKPDGQICNPVDGEEVGAVDRHVLPAT